jgi:hypothetical protein
MIFGVVGAFRYQEMLEKSDIRPTSESIVPRIEGLNLYANVFKEPFELVLFQFIDGSVYLLTTQHADHIEVPPYKIVEGFKRLGYRMSDLVLVVHNHLLPSGFSIPDNAFYALLRSEGFHGVFGIYYPMTKTVIIKPDFGWGK